MTIQADRPHAHFGLWSLLMVVTAFGGPIAAQSRQDSGSRVTVFADINFGGQSASFGNDTPNMVSAGWNDNISSIRIPNGEAWEVCQDVDYRNQCQTLTGSVSDLRTMGWNDRISSMRRVNNNGSGTGGFRGGRGGGNSPYNGVGVTVYVDPNFRGQSETFRNATPTVVPYGLNDKISSIRIPNGESWEVCQDIDYGNQCQVLTGNVADLRSMGWDNRISSLRFLDNGNNGGRRDGQYRADGQYRGGDRRSGGGFQTDSQQSLLFFNRPGYRGSSTVVTGGSARMGFPAWDGSVQIRGGGAWEICDGTGGCVTINQDVSDISDLGLNDRITSARVVNNSQYRRDRN